MIPEAEGWRTAEAWPPASVVHRELALRADGTLGQEEGEPGTRKYMMLGPGLTRAKASASDPPSILTWSTEPLTDDVDMIGAIELQLDATSTAIDTGWTVTLQDVDAARTAPDVTAGYLRASLREIDEDASRPGAPVLACRNFQAVPVGETVHYRIPLVPSARRFQAGHRIQLVITSDDQDQATPAIMASATPLSASARSTQSRPRRD